MDGDDASDVALTISACLPVSAVPSGGTCTGDGPVTCTFGALAGGTFERVDVTLAAPPVGTYTLAASAATTAFDPFLTDNTEDRTQAVAVVGTEDDGGLPRELTLSSPRPNPSRGAVTLRWGLPAAGPVDVRVYDLLGREVARLADGAPVEAGWHEARWDARSLASGVYVVRLRVADEMRTRRVTVLR